MSKENSLTKRKKITTVAIYITSISAILCNFIYLMTVPDYRIPINISSAFSVASLLLVILSFLLAYDLHRLHNGVYSVLFFENKKRDVRQNEIRSKVFEEAYRKLLVIALFMLLFGLLTYGGNQVIWFIVLYIFALPSMIASYRKNN